jgi:hypothetical protein
MRLNYLHEVVDQGITILKYIDTLNKVADILTKSLPMIHSHQHFLEILTQCHFGHIPEPKAKVIYKFNERTNQTFPGNQRGFKYGSSTGNLSNTTHSKSGMEK